MPRKPINYAKTIIYRIVCNDVTITDSYVGHTTDYKSRKRHHKSICNNVNDKKYNLKVYQFIRANGGWKNFTMLKIENYPCKDVHEATVRERYWAEHYVATLNSNVPSRTKQEWFQQNKEQIKEYKKEYYEQNKEHYKEWHAQYAEKHKEQILIKQKEYYEQNKKYIKEYRQSKSTHCECCNVTIKGDNWTNHCRTKKHQSNCSVTNENQTV
jgi:hypothetical protein